MVQPHVHAEMTNACVLLTVHVSCVPVVVGCVRLALTQPDRNRMDSVCTPQGNAIVTRCGVFENQLIGSSIETHFVPLCIVNIRVPTN